ncbi:DNA polymerase III subunit delta' [Thermopetrobacter sp. TC1]|uniref:DNA polymerase III subunit delta' n=1 Tax=Thermopetrobacter sp. TC1 TaxID=1495045 RepID=UPI00056FE190|nr:DNA polymerase III subunit delta' [Thermopetrobacter sp. TC1]
MARAAQEKTAVPDIPHPAEMTVLVGHLKAEARMLSALRSGRLHHAWLLSGPEGIGKATLAWRFARYLLAHGDAPPPEDGDLQLDPAHPVFRRVAARAHPDLVSVERIIDEKTGRPKRAIGVDEARRILHFLTLTPAEGGWRVVIVDPVDDLNLAAANALLKTLEEPPQRTLFLLISHAPGRLLPTIRSRCLHLPLRPLTPAQVRETLALLDVTERTDAEVLEEAIAHCQGAPGLALKLVTSSAGRLFSRLRATLDAGGVPDRAETTAIVQELAAARDPHALALFVDLLRSWLQERAREAALHGNAQTAQRLARAEAEIAHLLTRAESLNLDTGLVLTAIFQDLTRALQASPA